MPNNPEFIANNNENENSLELTTFIKAADIPIDGIAVSASWLDEGMRLYFTSGAIVYVLQQVKQVLIAKEFSIIFGALWNYVDALGGLLASINAIKNLDKVKRHKFIKQTLIATDVLMSGQLTGTTTLTVLASHGVFHGIFALTCSPLGGFGFAACMWASFIRSAIELDRARKKTDLTNLLEDRLQKLANLKKMIEALQTQLRELNDDDEKKKAIKAKIEEFQITEERLKNQALAMARELWAQEKLSEEKAGSLVNSLGYNIDEIQKNPSDHEKHLVTHLLKKQEKKVLEKSMAVLEWGLAAVGMTMIALIPFVSALLIPGVVVVAVAGTIKLGHVTKKLVDYFMDKWEVNSAKERHMEAIYRRYNQENLNPELDILVCKNGELPLSIHDRTKLKIAFELNKAKLTEDYQGVSVAELENRFYNSFKSHTKKKVIKFLDQAIERRVDDEILQGILDENYEDISAKDRKEIIKNQCKTGFTFFHAHVNEPIPAPIPPIQEIPQYA